MVMETREGRGQVSVVMETREGREAVSVGACWSTTNPLPPPRSREKPNLIE